MDYSQFLTMGSELMLLVVFLIVFLFDTFGGAKAREYTSPLALICFSVMTVAMWLLPTSGGEAFSGMYYTSGIITVIKTILNLGVILVILQSVKWIDSEEAKIRRGEFYELMMVTLFGMYLMISARHFLLFIIGLECASLPLAAMVAFNKNQYESHEAAVKYIFTAVFSSAI